MTDRKYTRAEFVEEFQSIRKWKDDKYYEKDRVVSEAAEKRLLTWFDQVQYDLGHVGSLYENLKRVTSEKVAAEVRAEEAEQRIWHLERQLAAKRVEEEQEEDD